MLIDLQNFIRSFEVEAESATRLVNCSNSRFERVILADYKTQIF